MQAQKIEKKKHYCNSPKIWGESIFFLEKYIKSYKLAFFFHDVKFRIIAKSEMGR